MRRVHLLLGWIVAVAAVAAGAPAVPGHAPAAAADCPLVVRVELDGPAGLRALASRYEPWEVRREEGYALLGVSRDELEALRAAGYLVTVDGERTRELCRAITDRPKAAAAGIPGFECYRTLAETYATAAALATAHPRLAEWRDIGDSWEKVAGRGGHDLRVLRLTNLDSPGVGAPDGTPGKPVLYVQASMHAREYTPAETALRFAEELLAGYGHDPDLTWMLDQLEIHLLLMANPDGRVRAEQGIPWRKNADDDFCTGSNLRGVDLNRNFDHGWGCCDGSSGEECSEVFRGPSPASEPETVATQHYLRSLFDDRWSPLPARDTPGLVLDLHSYGRQVLWPWGATSDSPPNGPDLERLGTRLAAFSGSYAWQAVELYPVDGSAIDFAYADRGVATYTIEIGYRFFELCGIYENALADDMLATLRYAARVAAAPYLWPSGPEVDGLTVTSGGPVFPGDVVELSGHATRGPVAGVEVTVDAPPWAATAAPLAAAPLDGAFDSAAEPFVATVPTADLAGGRHLVFARAQADDGTWGAPWAVFLDIVDTTPRRPSARLGH